MRAIEDSQIFGFERLRYGGDSGGVFGADMASAAAAVTVKDAGRAPTVFLGINGCGRAERLPAKLFGGLLHVLGKAGAAQGRHGIFAASRAFVDVALGIDHAFEISGFTGDADFALHQVVVGFELIVSNGPILQSRSGRNGSRAVAFASFGERLEIPGIE